ncbi:MAG: tRNA dimethylallyltransferase [Pirellulaceae bacterium]|jgi:tRNA dimethylallyltransferase
MSTHKLILPTQPALDCWYLTGATASGKTAVGVELAEKLNAEIISLDSMAIYREMDIGTAKPTLEQRAAVVHHMIDILDPVDEFSVSDYLRRVHSIIEDIVSRGKLPLVVGGTSLYLKAMLRGLFEGPPADWAFREEVEKEVAEVGIEALHQRLAFVDPLSADKLHPNDKRRIIRALEVHRATGTPISHFQMQFDEGRTPERCRVFVLSWPRPELHMRIDERVDSMFEAGLIEEAQSLLDKYGELGRTAMQAVGYQEAFDHLAGIRDLPATIDAVKARTHQFARRQETWFRSLSECRLMPRTRDTAAAEVAQLILEQGRSSDL